LRIGAVLSFLTGDQPTPKGARESGDGTNDELASTAASTFIGLSHDKGNGWSFTQGGTRQAESLAPPFVAFVLLKKGRRGLTMVVEAD
jgi:hypothetical protein